ncbi:MAG: protein kinase [Rubrivivax sp.]|nr:protein kinase [Rubrivivax sp.]
MTPTPPWSAVRALFEQALPLPAAERAALLAATGSAGPAGAALAAEVRSLLQHEAAATGGGLSLGAAAAGHEGDEGDEGSASPTAPAPRPEPLVEGPAEASAGHDGGSRHGQVLGAWRITALLGRGGMGEVWLAERADGAFEGTAAIKVLKRGMDSEAVLARFAQEQRALARLAHPHIARLMDAGRTGDGLPYFVMERVQGRAIHEACAGRPLAERLRLFLQLADAVAHAHRNLLVHRDLKPGNVMVDGEGGVKLLDFGIAKALDPVQDSASGDQLTATGERPFTPHYASPEQVRGDPITTATDIYSLGVLLYVLLTGQRPYGRGATTPAAAARCVLEEEPSRPSSLALPTPGWERTRRQLEGDLDNILLKTLEKRPEARYASVDALAADIRAYLGGFPVSARPASWTYRTRKLLARHRLTSAAAAAALLGVVGGAAVAVWQAHEARRERASAEAARAVAERRFGEVRQLAGQLVFKYHDKLRYLAGATDVRAALLGDAAGFLDSLRDAARSDRALARELADTYFRIAELQGDSETISTGQLAEAEASLDKAIALLPLYVQHPDTSIEEMTDALDMFSAKARMHLRHGRPAQALAALQLAPPLLEAALARQRAPRHWAALTSAVDMHVITARTLGLSISYANLGRLDEARKHIDLAMAYAEELLAPSPNNVESLHTIAVVLGDRAAWRTQTGDHAGAVADFERQLALRERNAASRPDDAQFRVHRAVARGSLAGALAMAGRHAQARQRMDEALAFAREQAAADPGNKAAQQRLRTLAMLDARQRVLAGDAAGARRGLEPALREQAAGDSFVARRIYAETRVWAARAWREVDARRALALADEAARLMDGADDNAARAWTLALARGERARALARRGDTTAAAAAAREALQAWPAERPVPASFDAFVAPVRALAR